MDKPNRSELRKIIMTILYQKSIYEKNKIDFTIDNLINSALEIDNEFVKETIYVEDPEGRKVFFHSASHLMAMAVKKLFPEAKVAIGPAIADGFYYDFDVPAHFTTDDLAKIEKEMQHLAKKSIRPRRYVMNREDAIAFFTEKEEPYKVELIQDLPEGEEISFYEMGDFTDMCVGYIVR